VTIGRSILALVGVGLLACTASAQWTADFEPPAYSGSAAGTVLSGQQGWYLPVTSPPGKDYNVFTYANNAYGFVQNPEGGAQFAAGRSEGSTNYARAEHLYDWGTGEWTVTWDIAAQFNGTLPASDYLGSFSLQPSATARYWQTLFVWNNLNTADKWHINYITRENALPGVTPGPAWDNLDPNHWYRLWTTFSMATGGITEVAIKDLTTGIKTTLQVNWTFVNPTNPDPTALRFFTGGTVAGNICAWDNLNVIPEPASLLLMASMWLLRRR